ncbi:LIF receptor subunit alpha a [Scyliorhinus canicula]|uniref:LIF receptor subunit alpha a n=1 Tax=Scyliorhinus canicula TaxID=7830 RepID=UPI0018F2E0FB|nr:LIF receptor subunit alpha a [Scyliorhinus canicula]XP_038661875.1 LIF receptor subunit alpha a [Scyliorhinus canicula]XP_038661876.1 LIF receptor subunit alpha a [Scyliorhinus canicula]XP_038661877.1 LIF receptor subunit alpha a [Scyliorhinus canicula]XP_038661878.1 LIF receptor subunit alpha a [Scyliorhinus canicula]XP_038661879.1 LIF receptor subunit alpha a [Scyliorhinus canicula]XP_038661880.1 LIF receptor subunit alpha a [Scyliorhinus canicula]XP_038661881.1 LIF receptor subunit alp
MKLWALFEFVFLALLSSGCHLAISQNAGQCGSISMKQLVTNVGSHHNVTCNFCSTVAADTVRWEYAGNLLSRRLHRTVNSTASMVSLLNLGLTSKKGENLTCTSGSESYSTLVRTGYPPDAPQDLECVTQNFAVLICSWKPGRDTNIETVYRACPGNSKDCTEVGTNNFVERDFYVFEDLLLQITAINYLGTRTSELFRRTERDFVFQPYKPELLSAFQGPSNFDLTVEWNEGGQKYGVSLNLIFQVQVLQAYNKREVWRGIYSSNTKPTWDRMLQLIWTSDMPIHCTSHYVRIRSISNDSVVLFPGDKAWSDWSPLLTLDGLDTDNRFKDQIYPMDGTVLEVGTSLKFCCIAAEGKTVEELTFGNLNASTIKLSNRSQAVSVQNIAASISSGTNVVCRLNPTEYIGAVIYVGYPPDVPQNLSCETRDLQTLTCTWHPGRLTSLTSRRRTTYCFIDGPLWEPRLCGEASMSNPDYRCGIPISNGSGIHNISIHATNPLGEAQSHIQVDVARVFHPFAPHQLKQEAITSITVTVSWSDQQDYTGTGLFCEMVIRDDSGAIMLRNYPVTGGPKNARHTVILNNLTPYTRYSITARYSSLHFWKWSEWSNLIHVTTEQAAPSVSLNIWRRIKLAESCKDSMKRNVTLYWKPLSAADSNGPVLSYSTTWEKVGSNLSYSVKTLTSNSEIQIDQAGYIITVIAQNIVGKSPPSVIRIRPHSDDVNLESAKVIGVGGVFNLTWQRNQVESCGYTIQWCPFLNDSECNITWQKFPSNVTSVALKSDTFQDGVRYNLEVYECRNDGDYLLKRLVGYVRELGPSEAPKLNVKETTENSVHIQWNDIPVVKQRGFIKGFKVYYSKLYNDSAAFKPMDVQRQNIVDSPPKIMNISDTKTFTITGLEPGTTYKVALIAYTGGGESPSRSVTVTTPNSPIAVILGVTLPLVGIITLGIILSIFCYRKQEWIKETFYPDIPDPKNSKILQDGNLPQGGNLCKTLEPKDCTPNEVQVVEDKPIAVETEKALEGNDKGEDVPEDISDADNQNQGVVSYSPHRMPAEPSGKTNPAFEAAALPPVYSSEVTYTSIRDPGYQQQETPGDGSIEDTTEVIVKSGYQPQIHRATNVAPNREQPGVEELMPHASAYQPQAHRQSWSLDSGDFPLPETESIGSPTSINSQAFLIPERLLGEEHDFRPNGKLWSLPFFQNSRMSFDSNDS